MRESRTYRSGRGACDETHFPTATDNFLLCCMSPQMALVSGTGGESRRDMLARCAARMRPILKSKTRTPTAHSIGAQKSGHLPPGYAASSKMTVSECLQASQWKT